MKRFLIILSALLLPAMPLYGETVTAARTIRSQSILTENDITMLSMAVPGAVSDPAQVIGKEARVVLYAGRPIRPSDIGPPAIVRRNQIVTLQYRSGNLLIAVEGRALGRGGVGDTLRVMNLASRVTVSGRVAADGSVIVSSQADRK